MFIVALHYFDEALKRTPEDKRALVGRSWARAKACHYKGALSDINKALSLDSGDLLVLAHKALNTFLSCEFEEALVQNLRLLPQRKKPDSFVMGVMHVRCFFISLFVFCFFSLLFLSLIVIIIIIIFIFNLS